MVSVLHVSQPTSGGVGRAVLGLARAQHEAGLEVTVACPPGPLAQDLGVSGIAWQRWDSARRPTERVRGEGRSLAAIVAGQLPDLVHLHSSKAGLVGRLTLRRRVRTVFQPHAWSFLAVVGGARQAAIRWERFATRWTDITLFCSLREQRDGASLGIAGTGRVVLNGVDLDRFAPGGQVEARHRLSVPAGAFVACVVGRRSHQKGQDIALRAWPAVRAADPNALLLLIGDGYQDGFDATTGVLTRAGRADVQLAYRAADLVLAPSRWEGLSLSVLEAMACGRSTVATEVAGSREALTSGPLPAAGEVVPPADPDALAAAVLRRRHDPGLGQGEGAAARRRAERTFRDRATSHSVQDAYGLVLADGGRPC